MPGLFGGRGASSAGRRKPSRTLLSQPCWQRRQQLQRCDHPAGNRHGFAKRREQAAWERLLVHRSWETPSLRLPPSAAWHRLPPPYPPSVHRSPAHAEPGLEPSQSLRRRPFAQDRDQHHHHREEHLAAEKAQRRWSQPTSAPFFRTAEARPHHTLLPKRCRATSRLTWVAGAVEHATARASRFPGLRRQLLVEEHQQLEEARILQHTLVQGDVSFRFAQQ